MALARNTRIEQQRATHKLSFTDSVRRREMARTIG
jgi:hypothetical protein